ncbi:MAG: hypothetical protein A3J67_06205 [Parcubacteria group bacterium RIFCSPHIGHO2_02_FULL_48_10b]|nr:MAG: hypothetical protein A3J67_06205 [Parcubacteria group bacterium RIFCSPHIGHO2_02_FULL_48_10b]
MPGSPEEHQSSKETEQEQSERLRREALLRHQREMKRLAEDIERTRKQFNEDMGKFWKDFDKRG